VTTEGPVDSGDLDKAAAQYGEDVEVESDKDRNFAALRKTKEALEAELAELRPLKVDKMIREAGFNPDSDEGTAIQYALQAKGADAPSTSDGVKEMVSSEFPGWSPKTVLSDEEIERQQAQVRLEGVRKESESDTPPDVDDEIAEAEAAGDFGKSGALKLQKMAAKAEQSQS